MDAYKVDFHIHTNYSDGQATPVEIVKKANINRNTFYLHYEDKEDLVK